MTRYRHLLPFFPVLATLSSPAIAQTEPAGKNEAVDTLPAVKVTGSVERSREDITERRSRSGALFGTSDLREVPFTVNVITSQEIANKQAKTIGEALVGDPAVRNDYGATGAYPTESFNIRGFSINTNGMLKDGMPMANQVTQAIESVDVVEVIRGPMGFRYGFVSPGGAINLVSKRPTDQPLADFTFSTDQYGSAKGHLDLGGRFGDDDRFGYRINTVAGRTKNFVRPIDIDRQLLAGAFDWRASKDTTFTLALDSYHYKAGPDVFHYTVPDANGNEIRGIPPDQYFGQKFLPDNDFSTSTGSLGVESKLSEHLLLSSQFAVYDWHALYAQTYAFNAQPNGDFNMRAFVGRYKSLNRSNTTFLNYTADALGLSHSLTGGFTITRVKGSNQAGFSGVLGTPDGSGGTTPFVNNFYNPVQFADTTTPPAGAYVPFSDSIERGYFASDEMKLGHDWRFLLALRHSYIDDRSSYGAAKASSTDPTFGVMFEVTPAVSLYASHATGLEKGATLLTSSGTLQFPPQKTRQIEVGAKTDLDTSGGGLATLDVALFSIEKAAQYVSGTGSFVPDSRETHSGGEVRLVGRVLPSLTLSTGLQYLHAKLSGDPATAGQRPQNVPKLNATFSGDWRVPGLQGLTLTAAAYHAGEREISVPNVAAKAGAYTRFDAGFRYETRLAGHGVTTRLNVENLTDRSYYNVGWYGLYEYGAPRTVSASVEVAFR